MNAPTNLYPVSDVFDLSTDTSFLSQNQEETTLTITRRTMNTDHEYYFSHYVNWLNRGGEREKRVSPRTLKERKARRLKRKQRVSCNKR